MQKASGEGKLIGMLLIDSKSAFDHVSLNAMPRTMEGMHADENLMWWTESFMSDKRI